MLSSHVFYSITNIIRMIHLKNHIQKSFSVKNHFENCLKLCLWYLLRSGLEVTSCPLRWVSSSSGPELSLIVENFLILLVLQVSVQILEFLMQSLLFNFAISDWLVKHVLVLLSEVSQLCGLFGLEGIDSCLHSLMSFVHPIFLLFSLHLKDLLLNFMGFREAK